MRETSSRDITVVSLAIGVLPRGVYAEGGREGLFGWVIRAAAASTRFDPGC
jgi:hypothetical protein